jgi:hypothetical protein
MGMGRSGSPSCLPHCARSTSRTSSVCASQPAAFQAVIADMGIAAERVLIFDDSAENVAGASA